MTIQQKTLVQDTREQFITHGLKCAARAKEIRASGANGTFSVAHQEGGGMALVFIKGDSRTGIGPHLRFGAVWAKNVAHVTVAEVQKWNHDNPDHPVVRVPLLTALAAEALKTFELISMIDEVGNRS